MISPEFGLETPTPLAPSPHYMRLEGWGFIPGQESPSVARLRIGESVHAPESITLREDVAERFPNDPFASQSGFLFVVLLPAGMHEGVLEFSADDGNTWVEARDLAIPVSPHPLMGGFEPAGIDGKITKTTRLAGWCWHPELEIDSVVLLQGDVEVPLLLKQERPDVAERFPDQPEARFAGFMTAENLPRGRGKIRLQVTTTCGRVCFLDSGYEADIKTGAFAPLRAPPEMWELKLPPTEVSDEQRSIGDKIPSGPSNVLFVLHGNFATNSAYHVTALANALIALGYDCVVAVPRDGETIGAQLDARFLSLEFSEIDSLLNLFRDGHGPRVTHLWTPREHLRTFWQQIDERYESSLVVHLEDNEDVLVADHLGMTVDELNALSASKLDDLIPENLSHPHHSRELMQAAAGITAIYDSLLELIPSSLPQLVFWPAATEAFAQQERNLPLRRQLGISDEQTVIFYHGNTHNTNVSEVGELYRAVAELNRRGRSTVLVRTGRDTPKFEETFGSLLGSKLVHLGFIKRAEDLPTLMSMADFFVQPGSPGAFNDFRFPSKLPEFFALGQPVILPASNLGKVVRHLKDAFVLPDADASAIADAIDTISTDQSLQERLAAGAAQFAQTHFSWTRSAESLIGFYREVAQLQEPDERAVSVAQIVNRSFDQK